MYKIILDKDLQNIIKANEIGFIKSEFFNDIKILIGDIFIKGGTHKYIRREGSSGNYKYIYSESSGSKGSEKQETKEETHQKAIKLIQNIQKDIGEKFNIDFGEGRGHAGMSLYANIRGKKYRISDHGVSQKWAEVYGYPDESFVIDEFNEDKWNKIKKEIYSKIEFDLKNPEKYEKVEYNVTVKLFKNESDIKIGSYKLAGQRGSGDINVKIKKVKNDSVIAEFNGNEKEIKNKFVLNWEVKEKRVKKTPLTDYKNK